METLSHPCALFRFKFLIVKSVSSSFISTFFYSVFEEALGNVLKFTTRDHCETKKLCGIIVGLLPPKKHCFICFNENTLKKMKNTFHFILKLFSFSRYLNSDMVKLELRVTSYELRVMSY